jgi:plasmid stabilization system protein ParE
MKTRQVVIDPDAKEDLRDLYHWIAASGSPASALNYLQRIQDFINGLDIAAERGTTLDIVDPGLRSIPFESVRPRCSSHRNDRHGRARVPSFPGLDEATPAGQRDIRA